MDYKTIVRRSLQLCHYQLPGNTSMCVRAKPPEASSVLSEIIIGTVVMGVLSSNHGTCH